MNDRPQETVLYRRANFVTQLPAGYLFTPSHAWLSAVAADRWRVGLTKFATRMLGEMVDHAFTAPAGSAVEGGDIVGWVEGFKAISDLYCVVAGEFAGGNAALQERITLVSRDPYGEGWLYEVRGKPAFPCLDVHGYGEFLDKAIDRLLAKRPHPDGGESDATFGSCPVG